MTTPPPPPRRRLVPVVVGVAVAAGLGLGAAALVGRPDSAPQSRATSAPSAGTTAGAPAAPTPTASSTPAPAPAPVDPTAAPAPDVDLDAPSLAFLGDSLTVGVGAPPERGFAWQTARTLGWPIAVVDGVSGSGFVAPGLGRPMPARVADVVAARPDVVVVAGGSNDVFGGYDADDVGAAATALLGDLSAGLPDATVVVMGPFPTSLAGAGAASPVRDAVRSAAEAAGAHWVDAATIVTATVSAESDWERYISADGLHPNELGYARLAQALAAELDAVVG
ncbi:SGNH/GDSL hydrolase family protein [Cellulomonas sp. ATA003]|uniref:SGNH/GDSL hydrolase family protein n=1 Tax=Cellulomonas sp. ATA003 TaxID=3073064 RepID=UPI002873384D|nr:SGNH/GDSL hydrolase family protein [Cellulomonas sp. ATA003]WNB85377.1 SGNH/GDSL hydrolase family protein [Cellulomonas sp. ATA003]